ncbi:multicopper oxidase domain-containing protein [Chloroflexi bacterium TSY]|nr:multicopper oxidase domain-containing protein [Chloroflexi bacterium TSY]
MKPGAIERWRLLNGSVDGRGFIKFIVVENHITRTVAGSDIYTASPILTATQQIDLLAFDGITLVEEQNGTNIYTTKSVTSTNLSPANRADFLFQAPLLNGNGPKVFSLIAEGIPDARDVAPPATVIMATLVVTGTPVTQTHTLTDIRASLASITVPYSLRPIGADEIKLTRAEAAIRSTQGHTVTTDMYRTRVITYSGWGGAATGYPYPPARKVPLPDYNSMAINGKKFNPNDIGPTMVLGTAEEWTVWNTSMTILTDTKHYTYGQPLPATPPTGLVAAVTAADHVFHIHQNPYWVISIKDSKGNELLPGKQPRWQDSVRLPRNGGRVIFRSRFPDFAGDFVNHCHLLQHEDWGMMQAVEVVPPLIQDRANYVPAMTLANPDAYAQPSVTTMYSSNLTLEGIPIPPINQLVPPPPPK